MRLLTTNLCTEDATVISASSVNPRFPVSNLVNPFRSKKLRSVTGTTTMRVTFDMQTTEPVDSVLLLWPRESGILLSDSAVIKIQANATNVWTSPAVDITLSIDDTYEVASHYFSSDQNYRYWSVYIDDPGNPNDFVELGVAWIGKSIDIGDIENGFKFNLKDQSKISKTDYGHKYVDEYPLLASLEFSYKYIDYENVQLLENAFRINGVRKPVVVVLDPEDEVFDKDHIAIYGMFEKDFQPDHVMYKIFNVSLSVEELL